MTSHVSWMVIRNNNAFLLKKRDIKKPFSTEANNLTNLNSYRYNGLIHKKSVGIESGKTADKKSFVVVLKRRRKSRKPALSLLKTEMKSGPRRSLYKLKQILKKNAYRKDLAKAALRRASAVLRAQRTLPTKKPRAKKTE